MNTRKATLLENILGVKKAQICEQEITDRTRPDDTPELRKALITEILRKHISKKDLKLSEVKRYIEDKEHCYIHRMVNNIVYHVWDTNVSDYTSKHPGEKDIKDE